MTDSGGEAMIAGGSPSQIAVLGNAFEDAVLAGDTAETTEAVEPVEEVSPLAPQPQETAEVPDTQVPVEAEAVTPVDAREAARSEEDEAEPSETAETDPVEPVEVAALPVIPLPVARPESAPEPREAEPAKPVEPKPVDAKPRKAEDVKPAKRAEPARKPPPRKQAGAGGNQQQNAVRGESAGQQTVRAGDSSRNSNARAAGNAAVTNYPGQVVRRLRSSLRYPAAARSARLKGEVHVSFVVAANGSAGSVRVVRSSGSPILDKAAMDTVRRASPFPSIPAAAGRRSWAFTVPLVFTR
ncbi:MAG: TonB family protein [Flavobacteriaceae bacterium]